MAAYATLQQAIDLYGESYILGSMDRDDDGSVDPNAFSSAAAQASSEMDSYMSARYDLPLPTPTPDVLVRFCVDITVYQCSEEAGTLTIEKRVRYEDAIKWLINLSKNIVHLPLPPTEVDTSLNTPEIRSECRVMTRRGLKRIIC